MTPLGSGKTEYKYQGADPSLLKYFENIHIDSFYTIYIETSEFTSLCPITGQPDWATIKIWYRPKEKCLESKSLKLYLMSYRMHGEFHEECVNRILHDIRKCIHPQWIRVKGEFKARGGIKFWPTAEWGIKI